MWKIKPTALPLWWDNVGICWWGDLEGVSSMKGTVMLWSPLNSDWTDYHVKVLHFHQHTFTREGWKITRYFTVKGQIFNKITCQDHNYRCDFKKKIIIQNDYLCLPDFCCCSIAWQYIFILHLVWLKTELHNISNCSTYIHLLLHFIWCQNKNINLLNQTPHQKTDDIHCQLFIFFYLKNIIKMQRHCAS